MAEGIRALDSILLGINIGALALVVYQTWLTRRALRATDESLRLTRRAVHLEMLPRGGYLTHVMVVLEGFQRDLARQITSFEDARLGNLNALREAASHGEREAKGLIVKPVYDGCPGWLQEIYGAGVQHYYQANGPFVRSLWDETLNTPKYGIERDYETVTVLDNLREGHAQVTRLLEMLNDLLPGVWLNSPASLAVEDFFDRKD